MLSRSPDYSTVKSVCQQEKRGPVFAQSSVPHPSNYNHPIECRLA